MKIHPPAAWGLACLMLLTVGGCSSESMPPADSGQAAETVETVEIFCATAAMPPGARINEEKVRLEKWPRDQVPLNATSNWEEIAGLCVSTPLFEGEPIRADKLYDPEDPLPPQPVDNHWYAVTITLGDGETIVGYSPLPEEDFVQRLAQPEPILLHLSPGASREQLDALPALLREKRRLSDRLYLNPRHIISVQPLTEDPDKSG